MELEFHVTFCKNLIFIKLSFSLKLNFLKINFQNKSILLDNFRICTFCYLFWMKGVNAHIGLYIYGLSSSYNWCNSKQYYTI